MKGLFFLFYFCITGIRSKSISSSCWLVDKLSWLSIHLFDGHLSIADHDISLSQQTAGDSRVGVHHITEFHLLLAKLFLKIVIKLNYLTKIIKGKKNFWFYKPHKLNLKHYEYHYILIAYINILSTLSTDRIYHMIFNIIYF